MDRSTQDAYANSMVHALHSAAYINVFEERVSAVKLLRQMGTGSLEVKTDVVSGNVGELIKVLKKELEKTWLTALEEGQKVTQLLEQSIKELENE